MNHSTISQLIHFINYSKTKENLEMLLEKARRIGEGNVPWEIQKAFELKMEELNGQINNNS